MNRPLRLFEGFGIELEYMIVSSSTLGVAPVCDELLRQAAGGEEYVMELEHGDIAWSNELALHVVELKTNGPARELEPLAAAFQREINVINEALAAHEARLLPTAMHPWMDPHHDSRLWPHDDRTIYDTYHRIFDCRGHGWTNLQSMHVNLPFADDEEFARLHAAVRLVLPLLPALAASSPVMDGKATGLCDSRLEVYRGNQRRVGSVAGHVVPEAVFSPAEYQEAILGRIYRDMAALDPEGTLRHEWINSRGAIARFDRSAIEIRVIDLQECPRADLAVAALAVAAVRAQVDERFIGHREQRVFTAEELAAILWRATREGERAELWEPTVLAAWGLGDRSRVTLGELWQHIAAQCHDEVACFSEWIAMYGRHGCLARRILTALGADASEQNLRRVWRALADSLATGEFFDGNV